ncbi:uncharacterized protein LOC131065766 isoform X1 [Cryptomeria japonica]|uniref:uncharacterized protein LOC131065766 isoform X1 n=1 Tax=Cryptomeria japonica TaxID=3369 RepID=UPI0025ABD037|nr:uncharacterized protein LOC131065766 isoform X1 [Cryptomeria japonica]
MESSRLWSYQLIDWENKKKTKTNCKRMKDVNDLNNTIAMREGMAGSARRWSVMTIPQLLLLFLIKCSGAQGFSLQKRELRERFMTGNKSFECSPSTGCFQCAYSEKIDEKYHCSETGHRMSYKCIEVRNNFKEVNKEQVGKDSYSMKDEHREGITSGYKDVKLQNPQTQNTEGQSNDTRNKDGNWRRLSETSRTIEDTKQIYYIYRSCVPPASEEILGIFGFEGRGWDCVETLQNGVLCKVCKLVLNENKYIQAVIYIESGAKEKLWSKLKWFLRKSSKKLCRCVTIL